MPLYNWIKCTEGEDLRYVCKDLKYADKVDLDAAWEVIFDDYINRFGLGKLYKRMLGAMRDKAIKECDYVITGDKFQITLANMEAAKLKQMLANKGEGVSINTVLVYLSKWIGYRINPREVTALEYFEMMKLYGKENKQK